MKFTFIFEFKYEQLRIEMLLKEYLEDEDEDERG